MTVLQIYKLADNENPLAIISFSDKGGEFKSININPCFYKAANRKHIEIVPKNGRKKLHDGDSFALLADSFWFRVQLTDGHTSNRTGATNKETISSTTSKPSQFQLKLDDSTNVTGDVTEESNQSHIPDESDINAMKTDTLVKEEVPPATKYKTNPSGKKFKSFADAITSGTKRNLSNDTPAYCKKIKVESSVSSNKSQDDKPVVDTKKLLDNIRKIVIEDYPEAISLLGDESPKKTYYKERKHVKTTSKLVGKDIKMNLPVKSLDSNLKKSCQPVSQPKNECTKAVTVDVKSNTEEELNDNSGNASKNEKAPTIAIQSHENCRPEDNLLKEGIRMKYNEIQQKTISIGTENTRQLTNIASVSATDISSSSKKVV